VLLLLALIGLGGSVGGAYLWAVYHYRAARSAAEKYHHAEAREHLEPCLRVWPRDGAVLLLAARVARRLQEFDQAEQFLDRYRAACGDDDDLRLERVLLRAHGGEVDPVKAFCRTLVDQGHPAAPLILEALTAGFLRNYRLAEASFCVDLWLERQPDDCQALAARGFLYELDMRPQEAVATYRRVIELDPYLDQVRGRLAGNLVDLNQAAEALPHLEYLCRHHPDDPALHVDLARCQTLMGRQEDATATLDGLLARQPRFAPALRDRGVLALQGGQMPQAEAWLRQACELAPGDYPAHYQLEVCLRNGGKGEEAQKVQGRLKQIEEDNKRLRVIIRGDMQRTPHSAALQYELGMILFRTGSVQEGLRWLQSALQDDPQHAPTHRVLATYYQRLGQMGLAEEHRQQAGLTDSPAARPPEEVPRP
jgi:tetratricopeptide (TPR) repeat protein